MQKQEVIELQIRFGQNLRKIREAKGLSLREVSERCDLDNSNISKIENGQFNIQLSKIFELANGLGVEAKTLLDFTIKQN